MALFTDGPLISTEELQKCENGILNLAGTENIDLAGKIALAQSEIANQLVLFLLRKLPLQDYLTFPWARRTRDVGDVVVTEPLRQWHAHKTLAMVYRDAYNNQLNDRYQGKWTEYEQLAKASSQSYFRIGVGVVANPIGKASIPILSTTAGIGSSGTFFAAVAWVNEAGQEGNTSDIAEITTADGQQVVITAVNAPANASSWNAYAGSSPETIGLQNSVPIGINSSWTMILGLQHGIPPGKGQPATWFLVDNHVIQRG
jgi:hypothetical protein